METEFSIFNIFTMLGGLAFFLYGMKVMSTGLEKLTGGKLEAALQKMTSNRIKAILLGIGVTIAIQSSSAMTVMLVGFVNSGLMSLEQTVGVCFGSDIGTTLTAWILSLVGVESSNPFIRMLKPSSFSPLVALIGVMMIMVCKKHKKKDIGNILIGFAILMTGMTLMSGAVSPLAESEKFKSLLTAFNNPILGVIVGAGFTGIIQSSAASVGILQAFSITGALTYGMAIPIIMGLNIGTCVTALLSSIGVSKDAKRVACIHISIKVIGTLVLLPIVIILQYVVHLPFFDKTIGYLGIAIAHSVFNLVVTIILLPFANKLVKLATILVKDEKDEKEKDSKRNLTGLDEILLKTPAVAVHSCINATMQMSEFTRETILMALKILLEYSDESAETIIENEDIIDTFEDKINSYLMKISKSSVTGKDSRSVSKMMHCVGNFERISDHARNLAESSNELHEKQLVLSPATSHELSVLNRAIRDILKLASDAFEKEDLSMASYVEPLEESIDVLCDEIRMRQVARLGHGQGNILQNFIFNDLITNLERISDHCSNIALAVLRLEDGEFDTHDYQEKLVAGDETFEQRFLDYRRKYSLV